MFKDQLGQYQLKHWNFEVAFLKIFFFFFLLSGMNVIFNLAWTHAALFQYGGELYFSDVYASLEVPEDIKSHKVLWGMYSCFIYISDY